MQDLLRRKDVIEARRAQDAENYRPVQQQRLARQIERESK